MIAQAPPHPTPFWAVSVSRAQWFWRTTETKLLTPDRSIFEVCIVILNSCSITTERCKAAFSSLYFPKLGNKTLNAEKNLELGCNCSTSTFMWHSFMNKGAQVCNSAGIQDEVLGDRIQVSTSTLSRPFRWEPFIYLVTT